MLTQDPSTKTSGSPVGYAEPKSAHSTPTVEYYVEKRKEKAEKQTHQEQKKVNFAFDEWKRLEYVIF